MTELPGTPRKRYYRVGDVAEMTGLEPHVLRYWETEFKGLRPRKSRGGQRLYSADDLDLVMRIRDLLHVEGYTIAGARRQLQRSPAGESSSGAGFDVEWVRQEIRAILTLMEGNDKL